jgi:hypothetical protein
MAQTVPFFGRREETGNSRPASGPDPSIGVAAMPDAISAQTHGRIPRLTLNSDGQRHPLLNAVTAFTFIAGIAAFALGLVRGDHVLASILGISSFAIGLVGQLYSATREQRVFLVAGIVAGFVGMGLGIGHGGF